MTDTIKKINLTFQDQVSYLGDIHRSGWAYVMKLLFELHDPDGTICDTYVDRTFHWANTTVIPYTEPWIGFVHHTFNTSYSQNNNVELLKNQKFLDSLDQCQGLFVFTENLRDRWIQELSDIGYSEIPVVKLDHPTETVQKHHKFSIEKFHDNKNKKIIQIGAWLRDSYSIYRLNNGKSPLVVIECNGDNIINLNKAALKGSAMSNYFRPKDFFQSFFRPEWKNMTNKYKINYNSNDSERISSSNGELPQDLITAIKNVNIDTEDCEDDDEVTGDGKICRHHHMSRDHISRDCICRDKPSSLNKYVLGSVYLLEDYDSSVEVIPKLSNHQYDQLLAENIVFINLVDAAAVNTLIECVMRNTPIVINKLPGVVEVLGDDYPLYFDGDLEDALKVITLENILDASSYIKEMNKHHLKGHHFLKTFVDTEIYVNL